HRIAQLRDAVLVNPYSPEEMSDAIARALTMPLAERKARWEKLIDNVRREDVMWWCELFITALEAVPESESA
ncbi:MAG: trehalose-6-phosphate synthase, partial [Sphingomonas sp.]